MARPTVRNGRWLVAGAGGLGRRLVAGASGPGRRLVAGVSGLGRLLAAGAGGLVLAGGITYVATTGSVSAAAHPVAQRPVSKPTPPAVVTVTPPAGAAKVAPDTKVQITASGGTLTQVTVASGNSAVTAQYGPGSTSWSTQ